MVTLAYLVAVLSIFSVVVFADDIKNTQNESVDEKYLAGVGWYSGNVWGNSAFSSGSAYGCGLPWLTCYPMSAFGVLPSYPQLWFKEVATPVLARRSISRETERIYRRDSSAVGCKNLQGQTDQLVLEDCHQAVQNMVFNKASAATCKSCSVQMVTPKGFLAATGVPAAVLQKLAGRILNSCATDAASSSNRAHRSRSDTSDAITTRQVAMILRKGDGTTC